MRVGLLGVIRAAVGADGGEPPSVFRVVKGSARQRPNTVLSERRQFRPIRAPDSGRFIAEETQGKDVRHAAHHVQRHRLLGVHHPGVVQVSETAVGPGGAGKAEEVCPLCGAVLGASRGHVVTFVWD